MNDRHTADSITSDALDQLYDQLDRIRTLHRKASHGETCVYCAHGQRLGYDTTWPCDTIRALDMQSGPAETEPVVDRQTAVVFAALHRSAEADVSRVIALHERWVKAGPPPIGTSISRWWDKRLVELHDAILPPAPEQQEGCRCHNGDELCSGCRRCPDICGGCDGPKYQTTDQPKEQ